MMLLQINGGNALSGTLGLILCLLTGLTLGFIIGWLIFRSRNKEVDVSMYEDYILELEHSNEEFSNEYLKIQKQLKECQNSKTELMSLAAVPKEVKTDPKIGVLEQKVSKLNAENSDLKLKNTQQSKSITDLTAEVSSLKEEIESLKNMAKPDSKLGTSSGLKNSSDHVSITFQEPSSSEAKLVVPKREGKSDDLKKIEGIGPAIEKLLNAAHIHTYNDLLEAEVTRIRLILDSGGKRYRMHNPGSWPKQAGLAAQGDWKRLTEYQESLKGGLES